MTFRFLIVMPLWIRCLGVSALLFCLFLTPLEAKKRKKRGPKKQISRCDAAIQQGVKGHVRFLQGNQMPGPGKPADPGKGVSREVAIFQPTRMEQAEAGRSVGFYKKLKTKAIVRFWTNNQGCFTAALPPGRYSLLVKEEGEWYANQFDGDGFISPFEVKEGEVTTFDFRITYKAAF